MKSSLPFLAFTLCASAALAEPPEPPPATDTQKAAAAVVEKQLIQPLQKSESKRKRFSRAGPVALERRVRVLDAVAQTDPRGKRFVRFAVDVRHPWDDEASWQAAALIGCAYPEANEVFVQRGSKYLPAASALGKAVGAEPDACRAAPSNTAQRTPPADSVTPPRAS